MFFKTKSHKIKELMIKLKTKKYKTNKKLKNLRKNNFN